MNVLKVDYFISFTYVTLGNLNSNQNGTFV